MVLIYTQKITPRLQYSCHFIFTEQLGIDFQLTTDVQMWLQSDFYKLNYSPEVFEEQLYTIVPHSLLFETNIQVQTITCFRWNGLPAFFQNNGKEIPFDLFAATFYLLSRYEEYLQDVTDQYGRFPHEESLAWKEHFLDQPLVNQWISLFRTSLLNHFPKLTYKLPCYKTQFSFDVDMARAYQYKGWLRNTGGFLSKPGLERLKVLTGVTPDPFDNFSIMQEASEKSQLPVLYFFLMAAKRSLYDKNISPKHPAMQSLIRQTGLFAQPGLHPSWQSHESLDILLAEKKSLESITEQPIIHSRQHYIRFKLPEDFEKLLQIGIKHEYSMGYGSINGFRASVASSFYWYNLKKEESTTLRVYPFCFMDANSYFEQKQDAAQTATECFQYYQKCKEANGHFIPIFHNHLLVEKEHKNSWRNMFHEFIAQVPPAQEP